MDAFHGRSSTRLLVGAALLAMACGVAQLGACTSLLGDDFEVVSASATGTPGGGGSGGTAGGGGSAAGSGGQEPAPPPVACTWRRSTHEIIASLHEFIEPFRRFDGRLRGARSDHRLRLFAEREDTYAGRVIDVYTLDQNNQDHWLLTEGDKVHHARPLDPDRIGVLIEDHTLAGSGGGATFRPELTIRVMNNNEPNGSMSQTHPITDPNAFADAAFHHDLQARFAPTGGDGLPADIALYISYKAEGADHRELYAHYQGDELWPEQISQPDLQLDDNDVYPQAMLHRDGVSYVFTGEPGSGRGMVEYVLEHPVFGVQQPRLFEPQTLAVIDVAFTPEDTAKVAAGNLAEPMQLFLGEIQVSELAVFQPMDLPLAAELPSIAELPVGNGSQLWLDDIFVFFGTSYVDQSGLALQFYDLAGNDRGSHPLPFNASIPPDQSRGHIKAALAVVAEGSVPGLVGRIHVAWIEDRFLTADNEDVWDVLYYDQLDCFVEAEE